MLLKCIALLLLCAPAYAGMGMGPGPGVGAPGAFITYTFEGNTDEGWTGTTWLPNGYAHTGSYSLAAQAGVTPKTTSMTLTTRAGYLDFWHDCGELGLGTFKAIVNGTDYELADNAGWIHSTNIPVSAGSTTITFHVDSSTGTPYAHVDDIRVPIQTNPPVCTLFHEYATVGAGYSKIGEATARAYGGTDWQSATTVQNVCKVGFNVREVGDVDSISYVAKIYSRSGAALTTLKATSDNTVAGNLIPPLASPDWVYFDFSGLDIDMAQTDVALLSRVDSDNVSASNYIQLLFNTAADDADLALAYFSSSEASGSVAAGSEPLMRIYTWQ